MRTIGAWDLWRHSSTFLILNAWFASMKCWGWKSAPPTQRSTSYCRLCLNLKPFLKVKHCFSGLFSSNIFAFGYLQIIHVAHRFSVVVELLVKSLFLYAVMRIEPTPASHSETIFSVAMARSNITTRPQNEKRTIPSSLMLIYKYFCSVYMKWEMNELLGCRYSMF